MVITADVCFSNEHIARCPDGSKARTPTPTLGGSVLESTLESADYNTDSADSTIDFTIVGRLSMSYMFNILNPLESADGSRPTSEVDRCKSA